MKNDPSPAKPNQLKAKYVVIGSAYDSDMRAFGTPSGRAIHGLEAAEQCAEILRRLYPDLQFSIVEVKSYLAPSTEV